MEQALLKRNLKRKRTLQRLHSTVEHTPAILDIQRVPRKGKAESKSLRDEPSDENEEGAKIKLMSGEQRRNAISIHYYQNQAMNRHKDGDNL